MNEDNAALSSILIVDDNTKNLQVLADILRSRNYKIAMAKDGYKALKFVEAKKPDIILLDIMMPEIDGFEVCRRLKSNEETKDIPVIFISALTETSEKVKGFEVGGVDYITKPFNQEEVFARVNVHLELKRSHEALKKNNIALSLEIQERKRAEEAVRKANDEITSSIQYARMIQASILPSISHIKTFLPDSFFIYLPKDIVSGDIFFVEYLNDSIIIALIDCTGHGVPGAFMTMIASSALRRVIMDEKNHDPSQILKRLNYIVKTTLHQDTGYALSDDGMDAAVANIRLSTLTFAGAKIPLIYTKNNEINIIKGDKQNIGYRRSDLNFDFTTHTIPIEKGMCFYLASDGFENQMGENNNSRFKVSRFGRERFLILIKNIREVNFESQEKKLMEAFYEYKGKMEIQDDVTVLGFRI